MNQSIAINIKGNGLFGVFAVAPALIVLMTLFLYPLCFSLFVAFSDYSLMGALKGSPLHFTGLKNYARLFRDPSFLQSIATTSLITACAMVLEGGLALLLAQGVSRRRKSRNAYITVFLLTIMIAPIVVAMLFRFILNDELGVLNALLRKSAFVNRNIPWLSSKQLARLSVVVVDTWQATSAVFLLFYTGIISIPAELYESARVDGAGHSRMFFSITLPLIRDVVVYSMVIRFMDLFRIFDAVYLLTNGGPAGATETIAMYIFRRSWTEMDVSKASAASHMMMLLIIAGILLIKSLGQPGKEGKS